MSCAVARETRDSARRWVASLRSVSRALRAPSSVEPGPRAGFRIEGVTGARSFMSVELEAPWPDTRLRYVKSEGPPGAFQATVLKKSKERGGPAPWVPMGPDIANTTWRCAVAVGRRAPVP